jgi:hypothetical protein
MFFFFAPTKMESERKGERKKRRSKNKKKKKRRERKRVTSINISSHFFLRSKVCACLDGSPISELFDCI